MFFFLFKQKTAYEMRISDWSSDVCSSDLLIGALAPEQVAEIATQIDTDDAVAIIEDMEEDEQQAVLEALHPEDRAATEDALSYPEESAGRLMQRDLVAVPEYMTVGQVIDYLREHNELQDRKRTRLNS